MEITIIAFFHIFFINTFFIVIDYFFLKKFTKTQVYLLLVVAAGLTSLLLGVYLTNQIIQYYFHDQWFGFTKGVVKRSLFVTGVLVLTLCNIVIELPFYVLATKNKNFGASLKSAVVSNLATNIPIGLLYLAADAFYSVPD